MRRGRPLLVWLLGVATLVGCGEGPAASAPSWVGLLDAGADPRVERAFDPLEPVELLDHASRVLERIDLADDPAVRLLDRDTLAAMGWKLPDARPGPDRVERDGGARLVVRPGEVALAVVPVPPGAPILVDLQEDGDDGRAVRVLPLPRRPLPRQLADRDWLVARAVEGGPMLRRIAPGRLRVALPRDTEVHALLVVAAALEQPLFLGELRVRAASPLAEALQAGGRTPDGQAVLIDDVARRALVLPAPARASWRVRVPDRAPRLELALARLGARVDLALHWSTGCDGVTRSGTIAMPADGEGWHPVSIELPELAGREIELVLASVSDEPTSPGDPAALVLGQPRLSGAPPAGADRPDVIVVSLDTLRADRLLPGSHATPHLQRLAADAAHFRRAVSTSSWTLPAHASLFTGRWPPTHGATQQSQRLAVPDEQLLAPTFRAAGYETAAVTSGGFVSPSFGLAAGFEEYGVLDPCEPTWHDDGDVLRRDPASRERLLELLSGERRRPLFLFVHTYAAHSWAPLAPEIEAVGLPPGAGADLRARAMARDPRLEGSDVGLGPEQEARLARDLNLLYDASASAADALVGELVAALEAGGRLDDTILVVLSDHGQEILDRGLVGHGHSLHAELVDVPLLLRVPGGAPAVIDAHVSLVDVAPTLRELAGLPVDPGSEGRSLVPLLDGGSLAARPLFAHVRARSSAMHRVERGDVSLLADEDGNGRLSPRSLHDRSDDARERVDLSGARAQSVDELVEQLAEHLQRTHGRRVEGGEADLDEATRRRLIELGYTGDG